MNAETFKREVNEAMGEPIKGNNLMGCGERYYDPYFLIGEALKIQEIDLDALTEREIELMLCVAEYATEVFY